MNETLDARVARGLAREVHPSVRAFGEKLASEAGAVAVLFYGSNLRTGSLEGVLDYYLLLPGEPEDGIWPRVSYHEWRHEGTDLRAKAATMTLAKFAQAASGELLDTTIWTRFVQPSALLWAADPAARGAVQSAIASAARTAARLAVAIGPESGTENAYWLALFEATYRAEFRIETTSRAQSILDLNKEHFDGLLPLALDAGDIPYERDNEALTPQMTKGERARARRWWARRRRLGKPINVLRLLRAATTFEGASRYAAWKIERHTGIPVKMTPWRERHPVLAAPGVLYAVWREKRRRK